MPKNIFLRRQGQILTWGGGRPSIDGVADSVAVLEVNIRVAKIYHRTLYTFSVIWCFMLGSLVLEQNFMNLVHSCLKNNGNSCYVYILIAHMYKT